MIDGRALYDMIEDRCPEFSKLDASECQEFMDELSDNVHNFMNLGDKHCRYLFTAGQAQVMQDTYVVHRLLQTQEQPVIPLSSGVPYTIDSLLPLQRQVFRMDNVQSDAVECVASAPEGNYGLYLKWGHEPSFSFLWDHCATRLQSTVETAVTNQTCTARHRWWHDTLYIGVSPLYIVYLIPLVVLFPLQDLTITCTELE